MAKRQGNYKLNPFAKKKREIKKKKAAVANHDEPYEDFVRENESFEIYYKHQNICKADEWDEFMAQLRSNLPVTFRVTGFKTQARALLQFIKDNFFSEYYRAVAQFRENGEDVAEPECLGWYPNEFAWQLALSRKDIRRTEVLYKLHNFLISETGSGNISRQEAVSMIPPLVLGVEPHHKVLDMCAAPGSKTAQLIEALHAGGNNIPSGFIVANDIDNNRCYMLVRQIKRLCSPCCVVTNADSSNFPVLHIKTESGELEPFKYDRILCDVPCSGDGTLRKNPDIWEKWNLQHACNLHGLQYRILKRGAELLKVGGKLVYSTCSLNPIENEAVLHNLLTKTGDALEIVQASHLLPSLKYTPGLTHWDPATKDMQFYKTPDEVPQKHHTVIRPHMFPPAPEDVSKYNLEKCIRVLPHQQNTGGFFIALLEKKKSLPWEKKEEEPNENANEKKKKKKKKHNDENKNGDEPEEPETKRKSKFKNSYKEEPFVFFEGQEEIFHSIKEFYKISDDFDSKNLLTRSKEGKKKNLYFCAELIRNLVVNNEDRVKFINMGVKAFARCGPSSMSCDFRLGQEGLPSIIGFLGKKRQFSVTKEDLVQLLLNNDPANPLEIASFSERTQANIELLEIGSCVLNYDDGELQLDLVAWRGMKSMRAYVDEHDTVHMLRLLGADVSKFEKNKFEEKREAEGEETETEEAMVKDEAENNIKEEAEITEDKIVGEATEKNSTDEEKVSTDAEENKMGIEEKDAI